MLGALIGVCALFGLAIGSFLNVVIYRVPRNESIVSPRSKCPSCGATIKDRDNVPVVSWLLLKGRCRSCGDPISPRYLYVELAGGALFAGAAARLGFRWDLPAVLVLLAGLLTLACIDLEHLILPKKVVYPTLALVAGLLALAAGETNQWHNLLVAAISSVAWFAVFFLLNLASPRLLGFGDVRLALVTGLGLGWFGWRYVVLGFFAANFIGAIVGLGLIATKKMTRDQPIPYGVFLALGTAFALFTGPVIVTWLANLH
ncbi:MAG TPA: prepilin peptidase [Acidimicrobiales bacterium]|jgi:leader peptidase (prepilin peptidase)/N-methyltransferase|nr:prepilin peptidase [Acidimicrobiales bacterium]